MQKQLRDMNIGDIVRIPDQFKNPIYTQEVALVTSVYWEEGVGPNRRLYPNLLTEAKGYKELYRVNMNWDSPTAMYEVEEDHPKGKEFKERWQEKYLKFKDGERNAGDMPPRGLMGSDPEVFVVDEKDQVIPAYTFLQDKKTTNTAYWDGFQAEFSMPGGRSCLEEFNTYIKNRLVEIRVEAKRKNPNAKLTLKNVVEVPTNELMTADLKYVEFGCKPSFNAYEDTGLAIADPRALTSRFAGGHLHYGTSYFKTDPRGRADAIVKVLDAVVGVAGVSMAAEMDNPMRRIYYGRAGEYRLPKHGLEYRVLSNFWLISPAISMLTCELFRAAIRFAEAGFGFMWNADETEVRGIINTCDVAGARKLLAKNGKVLEAILYHTNFNTGHGSLKKSVDVAMYTILNGLESLKLKQDLDENWDLSGKVFVWQSANFSWATFANGR